MQQSDITKIQLTISQENVLKQILDFIDHSSDRVFILKGYAGTGKTTLMRFLIKVLNEKAKGITQKNKKVFYEAMLNDSYLNALRCVFGYAVTCHKSQGGEWDEVYVYTPRNITLNPVKETYQWVYTSMTRARSALHMMDDFYIK